MGSVRFWFWAFLQRTWCEVAGRCHLTGEKLAARSASVSDLRQQLQHQSPLSGTLQQLLAALTQSLRARQNQCQWAVEVFCCREPVQMCKCVADSPVAGSWWLSGFPLDLFSDWPAPSAHIAGSSLRRLCPAEDHVSCVSFEPASKPAYTLWNTELKGLVVCFNNRCCWNNIK